MDRNQQRLEAGLVYLMAKALQRRCEDHEAIEDCARWLLEQGYEREAKQLVPGYSDPSVLARSGSSC
jgi:hypothetical protein